MGFFDFLFGAKAPQIHETDQLRETAFSSGHAGRSQASR
jgi:hypothetical protein